MTLGIVHACRCWRRTQLRWSRGWHGWMTLCHSCWAVCAGDFASIIKPPTLLRQMVTTFELCPFCHSHDFPRLAGQEVIECIHWSSAGGCKHGVMPAPMPASTLLLMRCLVFGCSRKATTERICGRCAVDYSDLFVCTFLELPPMI